MQDAMEGQKQEAAEHKKDGRGTPIGTDGQSADTLVDPPPKPPFDGPEGDDRH